MLLLKFSETGAEECCILAKGDPTVKVISELYDGSAQHNLETLDAIFSFIACYTTTLDILFRVGDDPTENGYLPPKFIEKATNYVATCWRQQILSSEELYERLTDIRYRAWLYPAAHLMHSNKEYADVRQAFMTIYEKETVV